MKTTRRSVLGGLAATGLAVAARSTQAGQTPLDLSRLTPEQRAKYEAMQSRAMTALGYERVTVPGASALLEWEKLKSAGRGWPIIIGGDDDLERVVDQFAMVDPEVSGHPIAGMELRSPQDVLTAASKLSFPRDLKNWAGAYKAGDLRAPEGDWPGNVGVGSPGPSVATDIVKGEFLEHVHILLIPTTYGWEVPAYLRWGDWNACPPPEYHVAALRAWHSDFGAELVGMNGDTINLRVANRPKSRAKAMKLAREQYGYCPDIVDQGVGTISALAATLMASEWWYLWWD
ncbi:DUF4253 domain-containing protein [Sphingomonas sp.]|uniref:DUF4253 domain-containing protein n=1 Tax=Sphingomonas sp. TaxID=28214 RepID=UPI0025E96771|nr:DUF4253 domain-containing protein [Sphingomonas sp.]